MKDPRSEGDWVVSRLHEHVEEKEKEEERTVDTRLEQIVQRFTRFAAP